ncbi:MAG: hypothetical protein JWM19_5302 [Actinomycetia bacterium]|nr:hypothetical protein [Actinomycetes bacterium]
MWRDRLVTESGNLQAALDWYIATGDADAALSLASGMAWLWFITGRRFRPPGQPGRYAAIAKPP